VISHCAYDALYKRLLKPPSAARCPASGDPSRRPYPNNYEENFSKNRAAHGVALLSAAASPHREIEAQELRGQRGGEYCVPPPDEHSIYQSGLQLKGARGMLIPDNEFFSFLKIKSL
jgi:hypothetical protein